MKRQEPYKNNEFTDNQPENKHNFANDEFLKKSKRGFISILWKNFDCDIAVGNPVCRNVRDVRVF